MTLFQVLILLVVQGLTEFLPVSSSGHIVFFQKGLTRILIGLAFLFTAGLLFSTKFIKNLNKQFNQLKWPDALFIGLFQAIAILPGVSRSGSTIVSGLWRGLAKETAFAFSFYLAIPAILGALVLKIRRFTDLFPGRVIFRINRNGDYRHCRLFF